MRRLMFAVVLAAAASAACTGAREVRPALGSDVPATGLPALRLSPASLGAQVSLSQRLTFQHRDDPGGPRALEALLEVDATSLRLAGFAMQHRVFTLHWDGRALTEQRAPQVPAQLVAADVLRDIQLAYWPRDEVASALAAGWRLEDGPGTRVLFQNGSERVRIRYEAEPRWNGRTTIENLPGGYSLVIDSVASGASR